MRTTSSDGDKDCPRLLADATKEDIFCCTLRDSLEPQTKSIEGHLLLCRFWSLEGIWHTLIPQTKHMRRAFSGPMKLHSHHPRTCILAGWWSTSLTCHCPAACPPFVQQGRVPAPSTMTWLAAGTAVAPTAAGTIPLKVIPPDLAVTTYIRVT